jgi:hypothetical protein
MQFLTSAPLVLAALAADAGAQSIITAHWLFDETSGTTASDSGPLGNHGALTNFAAAPWVPGQLGNALSFDGVDDYVLIAAPNQLPIYEPQGAPFSIAFWVNAPAQSDRRVYSEQAAAPANSGPLFTLGSGSGTAANATARLRFFVRTDEVVNVVNELSNGFVFDGTWHHVVCSDVAGRVRIWIDGVLDRSFDYSHFTYGPRSAARGSYALIDSVTLGAVVRNAAIATPLLGLVDDLRIYRTALSAADVQSLMTGGLPSFCSASLGEYGYGCGRGPLDLAATGSAAFGGTLHVQLFRGQPGALAFVCVGAGALQPQELTPFGYPGCTLYQPPGSCLLFGALGNAGSSPPWSLNVPNNPALACQLFGFQGVALGPVGVEFAPVALAQLGF